MNLPQEQDGEINKARLEEEADRIIGDKFENTEEDDATGGTRRTNNRPIRTGRGEATTEKRTASRVLRKED